MRKIANTFNTAARWVAQSACAVIILAIFLIVFNVSESYADSGLIVRNDGNDAVLTWSSNPRECFAILWRSNTAEQTPWVVLTNLLRASSQTTNTTFHDRRAGESTQPLQAGTNIGNLYRVLVIPDFWFDMNAIKLDGGPKNPGEDFLPFYYGSSETGMLKPGVELLVNGKAVGMGGTVDEAIQRVNFGTPSKTQWTNVAGFWFDHDSLADGEHTLQLSATVQLNSFVGDWSQSVTLTNIPVHVRVSRGKRTAESWWCQRLGCEFIRKIPTPEDSRRNFIDGGSNPKEITIPARPIDLIPIHKTTK